MLGNRKTAGKYLSCFSQNLPTHSLSLLPSSTEQISGELSDLIGGDFDPSFVTWLFDEVKNHYPEPASTPSAQPSTSSSSSSAPSAGLPARPTQPGRMFGAAVSGVKRDSREMSEGGREQPPHQRQRFDRDGAPSGPRNGGNGAGKSLFDRMGGAKNAQFAPGARNNAPLINSLGMPQAAFDAVSRILSMSFPLGEFELKEVLRLQITQTIQAVNSGAHPSTLATIPFPALAAHPLSSTLPPPVLAQAQAHAMAQAQAFAQMQNVWNSSAAGGFGPAQSGFNPQAAPFHPAFGQMQPPPQNGGFRGQPQAQQFQAPPQQQQRPKPPVVLPKKPELEAICKHGVECTKPTCGFSHPSPVATKESGLVLSSEACDKQLNCQDLVSLHVFSLPLTIHSGMLTRCKRIFENRIALNLTSPLPKRTLPPLPLRPTQLPPLSLPPQHQHPLLPLPLLLQTQPRSPVQERNLVNLEVHVRELVACLCTLGMSEEIRMVVPYLVVMVLLVRDVSFVSNTFP